MTDAKKPKPQVIECPTCHGAGTTTRRTVDGEVPDAECWKCLGIGWITQLPHAEGESMTRTTMPSQVEQAQARARGDGMRADHTATLPNSVFDNWPGDRDGLYRWLLARHYGTSCAHFRSVIVPRYSKVFSTTSKRTLKSSKKSRSITSHAVFAMRAEPV